MYINDSYPMEGATIRAECEITLEKVILGCHFEWFLNGETIRDSDMFKISDSNNGTSYQSQLEITAIKANHSGGYFVKNHLKMD